MAGAGARAPAAVEVRQAQPARTSRQPWRNSSPRRSSRGGNERAAFFQSYATGCRRMSRPAGALAPAGRGNKNAPGKGDINRGQKRLNFGLRHPLREEKRETIRSSEGKIPARG